MPVPERNPMDGAIIFVDEDTIDPEDLMAAEGDPDE